VELLDGTITIVLAIFDCQALAIQFMVGGRHSGRSKHFMTGVTRLMIALSLRRRAQERVIALGDYAA